jgi:hypothetical protein
MSCISLAKPFAELRRIAQFWVMAPNRPEDARMVVDLPIEMGSVDGHSLGVHARRPVR